MRLIKGEALHPSEFKIYLLICFEIREAGPKTKQAMHSTYSRKGAFLLAILLALHGVSCVSHSNLISLNAGDPEVETAQMDTVGRIRAVPVFEDYKIRPNDQLFIRLNAFEGSTGEFINRELADGEGGNRLSFDPHTVYFNSYSVSESGFIKLPMLEKVPVVGLTTQQLQDTLDKAYEPFVRMASTRVKLGNRRVTLLGEFKTPGIHYLYNEKNTLLEAIGLGGDFTAFGNRRKVKLIRETENGTKSVYLDLTRMDFVSTPYFYVQPNDVIYVEPVKAKSFDESARSVGVVVSSLSLAVIIANIFIK